jgi:hypothetical protein
MLLSICESLRAFATRKSETFWDFLGHSAFDDHARAEENSNHFPASSYGRHGFVSAFSRRGHSRLDHPIVKEQLTTQMRHERTHAQQHI